MLSSYSFANIDLYLYYQVPSQISGNKIFSPEIEVSLFWVNILYIEINEVLICQTEKFLKLKHRNKSLVKLYVYFTMLTYIAEIIPRLNFFSLTDCEGIWYLIVKIPVRAKR